MSNPSGAPAAPAHPLPSYLQADHLGPWGNYLQQVDRVTPYLGNLARWVETLKRPKRILIVDVPIELDNGTIAHYEGYRVQHNLSRGPGKGGVRFHQDVTLSEVMALPAHTPLSGRLAGMRVLLVEDNEINQEMAQYILLHAGARVDIACNGSVAVALLKADPRPPPCAPGYEAVTLSNLNTEQPAFVFIADESPLHRKLGVYENRG
eukprot:gene29919-37051_t